MAVEVHSVRTGAAARVLAESTVADLVVEITQRRRGYFDPRQAEGNGQTGQVARRHDEKGDFRYRAGCTLLIDPTTMEVRRVIRTPGTIADDGSSSGCGST